jgi:hypothetical protein
MSAGKPLLEFRIASVWLKTSEVNARRGALIALPCSYNVLTTASKTLKKTRKVRVKNPS